MAISLIRAEFGKCKAVMAAFAEYDRTIRKEPATTPEGVQMSGQEILRAQTKLVSAVLKEVGITTSEADLAADAYAAQAFADRDNLYLQSLYAQVRTANALEASLQPTR